MKYVCRECGYIYSEGHKNQWNQCIHCCYNGPLVGRTFKQALRLADAIKGYET